MDSELFKLEKYYFGTQHTEGLEETVFVWGELKKLLKLWH